MRLLFSANVPDTRVPIHPIMAGASGFIHPPRIEFADAVGKHEPPFLRGALLSLFQLVCPSVFYRGKKLESFNRELTDPL